jgi:hypothetical protein
MKKYYSGGIASKEIGSVIFTSKSKKIGPIDMRMSLNNGFNTYFLSVIMISQK